MNGSGFERWFDMVCWSVRAVALVRGGGGHLRIADPGEMLIATQVIIQPPWYTLFTKAVVGVLRSLVNRLGPFRSSKTCHVLMLNVPFRFVFDIACHDSRTASSNVYRSSREGTCQVCLFFVGRVKYDEGMVVKASTIS